MASVDREPGLREHRPNGIRHPRFRNGHDNLPRQRRDGIDHPTDHGFTARLDERLRSTEPDGFAAREDESGIHEKVDGQSP